jgi:hypothetical protein
MRPRRRTLKEIHEDIPINVRCFFWPIILGIGGPILYVVLGVVLFEGILGGGFERMLVDLWNQIK